VDDELRSMLLFTTKDTKFGVLIFRNLRVLRDLRGEYIFTVNPEEAILELGNDYEIG
jgi:hypothetical protein